MSKLKVSTISDPDNDNTALSIDTSGNVTVSQGFVPSTQLSHRNLVINGAMQVAQRGTSTTGVSSTDGYYACDRWKTQTDTGTWTVSQSTDAPDGFSNSLKLQCTTAGTDNADEVGFYQRFEGQDLQHLAYGTSSAKKLTASFWVKWNKAGTFSCSLYNQSNDRNITAPLTVNSADTWEYKTVTFEGDTSAGIDNTNAREFNLFMLFGASSALSSSSYDAVWSDFNASTYLPILTGIGGSTSDYVQITGVQLEVGSVATPFEHRSYSEELARCQRYYEKSYASSTLPGTNTTNGGCIADSSLSSVNYRYFIFSANNFKVTKRATPSVTYYTQTGTSGSISKYNSSSTKKTVTNTSGISDAGLGTYITTSSGDSSEPYFFHWVADAEL